MAASYTSTYAATGAAVDAALANGNAAQAAHADQRIFGFLPAGPLPVLSWDEATWTLTLSGAPWSYYRNSVKYTSAVNQSVTLPGAPPASGMWWVRIAGNDGTLSASQTPWTLGPTDSDVTVCSIEINNALTPKSLVYTEMHLCDINRGMHRYEHLAAGPKLVSGGVVSGYTLAGNTTAANTFGVSQAYYMNETLGVTVPALVDDDGATLKYLVRSRLAGAFTWTQSLVPYLYAPGGYIYWDNAGTLTAATAINRYINTYLLATKAGWQIVVGQANHASLAAAQAETFQSLSLTGLQLADYIAVAQLTWRTGNYGGLGKCRLEAFAKITVSSITVGTSTGLPALHASTHEPTGTDPLTGYVTSVGLSLPTEFTVSDSPVTASGTLIATKASQAANQVYAAPNGIAGMPVFRALVAADIPALDQTYQPLDADLTALAGLSTTGLIERTGAGTAGIATITAAGKALLDDADAAAQRATLGLANLLSANAYFAKANPGAVAWTKTGNGTATTSQALLVEVNGLVLAIAASTTITMPTLTAGTDYAIWCATNGSLSASSNHVTPPSTHARRIGGFHYAPGGNAAAQAGGDATPQINAYSFWDLKWRFAGGDPRGMALVAGSFWADIYLTNTDPDTNGTSAYNQTIADGASPPKIPTAFGGDGTTTYGGLTWFEVQELLSAYGKRAPTTAEFMALAYGVTEQTSCGTDPGVTGLDQARTSRWGILQATGNLWVWGRELTGSGAANAGGWSAADTEARGDIFLPEDFKLTAALLGAGWGSGVSSGSRAANWNDAPSDSHASSGARGVGDHLQLP